MLHAGVLANPLSLALIVRFDLSVCNSKYGILAPRMAETHILGSHCLDRPMKPRKPTTDWSPTILSRTIAIVVLLTVGACASPEEKAQSYYERGSKLLSQGEYAKASIEFRNALQLRKNFVDAWRGLLQIEDHYRNYQGEVPILRNIVELDSKDLDARLKLGHFLLVANALDQALDIANAAVELNSKNANSLALRGAVRIKLNDNSGAKRDANSALELDPPNAEALLVLAAERVKQGDVDGGLALLEREPQAQDLAVQLYKLNLFQQKGDLKQVDLSLRALVDKNPKEPTFRQALARLYITEKRNDDAEKELRALASADPSNVEFGLNVVRFLLQTKSDAAARDELVARSKAEHDAFPYQLALAEFDFTHGQTQEAAELLKKLIKSPATPQNAVIAQIKLAQLQASVRKFDEANAIVADILNKDNRNVDALKLRGGLKLERGQFDEAIADLRAVLNDQPRAADVMLLLATAYERTGSIELAEKQYADATNVSGFSSQPGLQYVGFLRRRGNQDRADEVLNELVRRSPHDLALLRALAEARLQRQDWAGAQTVAEQIQRVSRNSGALVAEISAAALSGRGDYTDSIKLLENTYSANDTKSVPALDALVNTMVRGQQADRAITFLQRILKDNPANAQAHVLLGSVLLTKNSTKDAMENFKAAIAQEPKLAAGYVALASYHLREHNFDDAEKVLRSGLAKDPDDFSMHMTLAGTLEAKADYDGAIAEYEIVLRQQPGSLVVANNLASLLTDRKTDPTSLERAYTLAGTLRKSPIPAFKDTLGWVYFRRGEVKTAIPLLEEAATALSNQSMVQYHLGMAYLGDGQASKASDQFKKALALNPDDALQTQIRSAQEKAAM